MSKNYKVRTGVVYVRSGDYVHSILQACTDHRIDFLWLYGSDYLEGWHLELLESDPYTKIIFVPTWIDPARIVDIRPNVLLFSGIDERQIEIANATRNAIMRRVILSCDAEICSLQENAYE